MVALILKTLAQSLNVAAHLFLYQTIMMCREKSVYDCVASPSDWLTGGTLRLESLCGLGRELVVGLMRQGFRSATVACHLPWNLVWGQSRDRILALAIPHSLVEHAVRFFLPSNATRRCYAMRPRCTMLVLVLPYYFCIHLVCSASSVSNHWRACFVSVYGLISWNAGGDATGKDA